MLFSMSLEYQRAGLEIRERFHLADEHVPRVHARLVGHGAREVVLVRTCNRLEAYCWWPEAGSTANEAVDGDGSAASQLLTKIGLKICSAWVDGDELAAAEMLRFATLHSGRGVASHLFRVASGLESQILGDIHIIGQLRRGLRESIELESAGTHLHRLFETAFRVGKRVKRETHLMSTRSGVGSEAARTAIARIEESGLGAFAVIGSGKIGTQAARSLSRRGVRGLTIVNRRALRAERLATELGHASGVGLARLPETLARASAIIVATAASEPVITDQMILAGRREAARMGIPVKPLLIIDVCVPRNVAPSVGKLEGVSLVDLDTLHPEAADIEKLRLASVPKAEAIVTEAAEEFQQWLLLASARRALTPLRGLLSEVCRREIAYFAGESEPARRATERIVARVMANPMIALRAASARGEETSEARTVLETLFA